ncbi:MAG: c-type cytochrome [Burkholderiaceae bacterium]
MKTKAGMAGVAMMTLALAGCWSSWDAGARNHMGSGQHMGGGQRMGGQAVSVDPIARGGRGYDKWWAEYGLAEPKQTHPSYPAIGKAKGSGTWRCKECHGWDYLGRDGAYKAGSHATGIIGIRAAAGKTAGEIEKTLTDQTHRYGELLPAEALGQIARFVSEGQIDMSTSIGADRAAMGNAHNGRQTFEAQCSACHGNDGREIDFNAGGDKPEFVGTLARDNPWEALHKLRNGQPGESGPGQSSAAAARRHHHHWVMPPMRERLTVQQQADLLAHLQSLPAK